MLFAVSPEPNLTGIAALRAKSEVLEAKRAVQYFELPSRSLLNRVRPGKYFAWGINPYRGCEFGCRYCYARYTHEFMELRESEDFEDKIYAKSSVAENLRRELRKFPGGCIVIGTATDPYQPAERRFGRTRAVLEVLAEEHGLDICITTKSDLVARDIELLKRVKLRNSIAVNMTVTTVDTSLARLLEPRAPRPDLRLKTVRELVSAGIDAGVLSNPIMPGITDQEQKMDRLAKAAKDHGAGWFGGGALFLKPCSRRVFLPFVAQHFPALLRRYEERYERDAYLKGPYIETLQQRLTKVRDRYGLAAHAPHQLPVELPEQGSLF